jgi:hypothetical protein
LSESISVTTHLAKRVALAVELIRELVREVAAGYSTIELVNEYGMPIAEHIQLHPSAGELPEAFRRRQLDFYLPGVEQWRAHAATNDLAPKAATALAYRANACERELWPDQPALGEGRTFLAQDVRRMLDALRDRIHCIQFHHLRHHKHCMAEEDLEAISARGT